MAARVLFLLVVLIACVCAQGYPSAASYYQAPITGEVGHFSSTKREKKKQKRGTKDYVSQLQRPRSTPDGSLGVDAGTFRTLLQHIRCLTRSGPLLPTLGAESCAGCASRSPVSASRPTTPSRSPTRLTPCCSPTMDLPRALVRRVFLFFLRLFLYLG